MRTATVALLLLLLAGSAAAQAELPVPHFRLELQPITQPSVSSRISQLFEQLRARTVGVLRPKPGTKFRVTAVAYSPTIAQNDASPCLTAAGTIVQPGTFASNIFPLGTRIKVTTASGEEMVGIVVDRMNARYNKVPIIDVWHPTTAQARTFGKKIATVEVLGYIPRKELNQYFSVQEVLKDKSSALPETRLERVAQFFSRFLSTRAAIFRDATCIVPKKKS